MLLIPEVLPLGLTKSPDTVTLHTSRFSHEPDPNGPSTIERVQPKQMFSTDFSPIVQDILKQNPEFLIPLSITPAWTKAPARPTTELFADAPHPAAAHAGLWLYAGDWHQAHNLAQDLHNAEGSYWHAILHRIEQDWWNAGYWRKRVATHPIHHHLTNATNQLASEWKPAQWPAHLKQWDSARWFDFVEQAAGKGPETPDHQFALHVQKAEWELLFRWCATGTQKS